MKHFAHKKLLSQIQYQSPIVHIQCKLGRLLICHCKLALLLNNSLKRILMDAAIKLKISTKQRDIINMKRVWLLRIQSSRHLLPDQHLSGICLQFWRTAGRGAEVQSKQFMGFKLIQGYQREHKATKVKRQRQVLERESKTTKSKHLQEKLK